MLRLFLRLAALAVFAAQVRIATGETPACEVAVVFRSGSEVYQEAVSGIREALQNAPCRIQYFDLANPAGESGSAAALASRPRLVAAVGIGAWERLGAASSSLNIVPALVLREDLLQTAAGSRRAGAVYADVPLITVLERLREIFPDRLRVGLIHRPSWKAPDAGALSKIRQMGYELRLVECAGPDKLLASFSSLKGKVDFVVAEPDAELYNSATVKPLVLASLEKRLPIVGFSAGFVRAGALVGVYPDFHGLGRQTGELLARLMAGQSRHCEEGVRKVVVAMNERIVRLVGVEPSQQEGVTVFK